MNNIQFLPLSQTLKLRALRFLSGLLVLALLVFALPAHPLTALAEIEEVDTHVWSYFSGNPGALLGNALSPAGDVNGDGFDDVLIGAYLYESNDNLQGEGRTYLFSGSPSGLGTEPSWSIYGGTEFAYLGWAVAGAGDVNGDGYDDVAISANICTTNTKNPGEVYVFYGGPDGPSTTANWSAIGDQAEACFGYALASAGDVNGDGYADLLVGAPYYDNPLINEGAVYLYYGSAAGLNSSPQRIFYGGQASAWLGISLSAGDFDNDGFSDIILGAPGFSNPLSGEGRVQVYFGSSTGPSTDADWTQEGDQTGARYGSSVAAAGDVDGDTFPDLLVGADRHADTSTPINNQGTAYLYSGGTAGLELVPLWTYNGQVASGYLGSSVSGAGDVNGDGFDDLVLGASHYSDPESTEGAVFFFQGGTGGPAAVPDWTHQLNQANARLGWVVAGAGDVNADGFAEIMVSAPWYETSTSNDEGLVEVFQGEADGLDETLLSFYLAPNPVDEGSPTILYGSFTVVDLTESFTLTVDWGDGTPDTVIVLGTARAFDTQHTFAHAGAYVVSVMVSGSNGTTLEDTVIATVRVLPPTLDLSGASSVAEGVSYALAIGSVVDPGGSTVTACQLDWGDGSPLQDCLAAIGGSLTHIFPDGPATHTISIALTDEDGTYPDVDTLNVTVTNVAPVAVDDAYSVLLDQQLVIAAPGVLANDQDVPADSLTASLVSGPSSGSLTLNANGSFSYTPQTGFIGEVSFTYRATDSDGALSNTATVTLTVLDAPPTLDLSGASSVAEGVSYALAIGPVVDPGGSTVTACQLDWGDGSPLQDCLAAIGGSLTHIFPDGPASHTISIALTDEDGTYPDVDTLNVTVTNVAPVAVNDAYTVPPDQNSVVAAPGVLANDQDVPADSLTASLVSGPSSGSLTLNANGSFSYTPQSGFIGEVSFTYRATDSDGAVSNTATVTLTVDNIFLYLPVVTRP